MTTGDHWIYYNRQLAAMGTPDGLLAPAANVELKRCSAGSLSGSDDKYLTRCPYPWVEVLAQPNATTAKILFPKAYFDWCKQYVFHASRNKPLQSASPLAKVLWALDIMTHVNYALIALNIPIAPSARAGRSPSQATTLGAFILSPFTAAIDAHRRTLELARSNVYRQYVDNPRFEGEVRAATMMPSPFWMLPLQWIGRGVVSKNPDPIYERIYRGVVPMAGQAGYSVASVGNKDAVEAIAALGAGDKPILNGILQWRLWCVRDGVAVPQGMDVKANPLGWGPSNAQKTLGYMVSHVAYSEKQEPELVYSVEGGLGRLFPNFAYAYRSIEHLALQLQSMSFEATVKRHVTMWIGDALPRADSSGRPLKDSRGYDVPQPVSYTDHRKIREGNAAQATADARAAAANPKCEGDNVRLCQQSLRIRQLVMNSPALPIYKAMMAIGDKLTAMIGAAVGVGAAVYPVEQPFVRTFADPAVSTLPNGPSTVLVPRVLASIGVLEELTGLDLCAECPEVPREAAAAPSAPRPAAPAPAPAPTPGPVHLCAPQVTMYEAQHQLQFTAEERARIEALCRAEMMGSGREGASIELMNQIRRLRATQAVVLPPSNSKLVIALTVAATATAAIVLGPAAAAGAAVVGTAAIVLRKRK